MRIVIVTGPFLPAPPAPGGAVERIWQELAEEFVVRGHSVVFLCRGHATQSANETIGGVGYVRRTRFVRSRFVYWDIVKDLFYSARMLVEIPPADIVVTNSFWMPILLPLLRRSRAKIIVNVARMPKGQLSWYRGVDRLAAVSRAVLDEIADQCPGLVSKTKVIANPIDTSIFAPPARLRESSPVPIILYAGRVHPEKGVHLLIEALRHVLAAGVSTRLKIVGPMEVQHGGGGRDYVARLRNMSADLPVEFSPPVFDKSALVGFYHEASIFCYPSLADKGESFGLAPLEAMATGLVPVVSDLACFRDFIEPGVTGVVFDHRGANASERLANSLLSVLTRTDNARTMGEAAFRASQAFSKERVAATYLDDFRCLMQGA